MFLLLGCMGPNDETLVDQLRVMAVVVEPPEVAPGAAAEITAYIADPDDESPEALVWTCTDLGDGCLESAEEGQGTTVAAPEAGRVATSRVVSPGLAGIVGDGNTVLPIPLWTLVCAPGLCPAIDQARDGTDPDDLSTFLADPSDGMKDVPLVGTSLGFSFLRVGARATALANPLVQPGFEVVEADVGTSVDLPFSVAFDGIAAAWGYTTAGGFDATDYAVEDGTVTLTWFAPEEAGEAQLWVVVVGEDGGSAVWTGTGVAR